MDGYLWGGLIDKLGILQTSKKDKSKKCLGKKVNYTYEKVTTFLDIYSPVLISKLYHNFFYEPLLQPLFVFLSTLCINNQTSIILGLPTFIKFFLNSFYSFLLLLAMKMEKSFSLYTFMSVVFVSPFHLSLIHSLV